jgi:hypothetical protein
MYCTNCGTKITEHVRFCGSCGKPVGEFLPPLPRVAAPTSTPVTTSGRTNANVSTLTFFPVATHKFIVLSLCSFSIYELYWFYQQWKRIRESSKEAVSPFWRAFFGGLWAIPLLRRIRERADASGISVGWSAGALGTVFMVLSILWRLPDPWWLISFGSIIALVPAVQTCQEINAAAHNPEGLNSDYTTANVATIVIGGLLVVLTIVGAVNPDWAG